MRSAAKRRSGPEHILVFGESLNDAESVVHLLIANNPALSGRVVRRPSPTSLTRGAGRAAVDSWVSKIGEVVDAYEATGKRVSAVVVHRDADGPDPHGQVEQALSAQLQPVNGRPVVPVQMIEAWWLLFPEATESIVPLAWRNVLPRRHRNVETVDDPKKELQRLTRPTKRQYAEADSTAIALQIRERQPTAWGTSASYERLQALAATL